MTTRPELAPTAAAQPASRLPEPGRTRWQPLRGGLVDLFYYDAEEFWFHDGRLLLRGNNGTGKSKVLALLLPFLLDGDLSPHRVEPDADPKKRMEWNLLLGGEHPYPERLGYTWLEFGRRTEGGELEFRTIGCGLKAVAGRGIARHWFFVTDQRVGAALALVDATGTALPRDRLADALAGHGLVYDRARDYRRAVDEALFGFGEQRYGALVDLLVQLRQPQLSKKPSERALSDALTEALPPLDQAVVADVAEAFRSLEEDRDALAEMTEAHASASSFLGHYRRYAAVAARRRAALPRAAQQGYEKARAAVAAAETAEEQAEQALTEVRALLAVLETDERRLQARREALAAGPEMQEGVRLRAAAELAQRLAGHAQQAAGDANHAVAAVETGERKHSAAAERAEQAASRFTALRVAAVSAAELARVSGPHRETVDHPLDDQADAPLHGAALAALQRAAAELTVRQERAVQHVRGLVADDERARRAVADARAEVERLGAAQAELAQRRADADTELATVAATLVDATRAHFGALREVEVIDAAALLAALELWVETLDGPQPAQTGVEAAGRTAATVLGRVEAALDQRDSVATGRARELSGEISRLEAGEDGAPLAPHTRDPAARIDQLGAPLWQLIDFMEGAAGPDAEARAGLEAALEAAGILDAWLSPDGTLRDVGTGDLVLRPSPSAPQPDRSVAALLRPAVDRDNRSTAAVTDAAVAAVLAAIGLGEDGDTWVDPNGRFRIGVLTGAWRKPAAQYIGRGAREAARRARLVELRASLAEIDAHFATIGAERETLAARRVVLADELAAIPDSGELRDAHAVVAALAAEAHRLAGHSREAADRLATAADVADTARAALIEGATDLALPATPAGLDEVRAGLAAYRLALAELWPAVGVLAEALRAAQESADELAQARLKQADRAERAEQARRDAAGAAEAHRTLEETVGAAVQEVERLLAAVAGELAANTRDRTVAAEDRDRAVDARGRAQGRREELSEVLGTATEERTRAAESLRRFAGTGLLAVALPELELPEQAQPWAPDPAVRLARQIDRELAEFQDDDGAWDRVQRRVTDELKALTDTLARHGNSASAQLLEDGIVVEVVFRGRPATVSELAAALASEVADRQRLLDEREREILENHLVNEVASILQELIAQAEQHVQLMNSELDDRPTSTGMRLRLEWRPREDGPAGLAEARRRLLRQTSDAWSAEDRSAVGGFLQDRIAEVRARDDAGTWLDHLTAALDYRAWHRFVIQRHQNGQWRPASGPASGGERVLAASVPLFAAASAHYASAGNPHAPRLVTLDEAFAGVDDNARAKYLGLLAAFDLDVVMTSEREWGCYPEVPGLSIAQLSRTDGIAAVLVSNWQWDGQARHSVPRPTALHPAAAPPEPVATGLFDES
ncbi:MAG: TIGR02680 family protein [Pseudonocardia sp.]